MDYTARRKALYEQAPEDFAWHVLYGEEYALASIHLITKQYREEIATATGLLGQVYAKIVNVLQRGEGQLLLELGIPRGALRAAVQLVSDAPTVVGRFDFAPTAQGLKMLEFNSDTPTGIVEAYSVNGRVCEFYGLENPNRDLSADLTWAFQTIVKRYRELGYRTENIFFSALDWHTEDAGTTKYLLTKSGLDGRFVALEDLRVDGDNLFALVDGELVRVDVLYRLHALEKLVTECDQDGYPTGEHVLELVARRRLALINPPSAFVAQTKAVQALIWNLHTAGEFFTPEEHAAIDTYMLPTYMENRFIDECPYVVKPIFGREGGGVTLFSSRGECIDRDKEEFYWEQPMVYQQRAELQTVEIETLQGVYRGCLLWGSFLIGGKPSALLARVGGQITNNLSYYLPVGIRG